MARFARAALVFLSLASLDSSANHRGLKKTQDVAEDEAKPSQGAAS